MNDADSIVESLSRIVVALRSLQSISRHPAKKFLDAAIMATDAVHRRAVAARKTGSLDTLFRIGIARRNGPTNTDKETVDE